MAYTRREKIQYIRRFLNSWQKLNDLAFKSRDKTSTISNEDDARFKKLRTATLPQYSTMKSVIGPHIDPDNDAIKVLNRLSSLKYLRDMPDLEREALFYRLSSVLTSVNNVLKQFEAGAGAAVVAAEEVEEEEAEAKRPRRIRPTFWGLWSGIILNPPDFFEGIPHKRGLIQPVVFLFKLFFLIGILLIIGSALVFRETIISINLPKLIATGLNATVVVLWYIAIFLIFYFVVISVLSFIMLGTSAISYYCFKMVGGRGTYEGTFKIHSFSYAPQFFVPFYLIYPPLIALPFIYQFILRVIGGSKVHRISYFRSLLGKLLVLVPIVIAVFLFSKRTYEDKWNVTVGTGVAYLNLTDRTGNVIPMPLMKDTQLTVRGREKGVLYVSCSTRRGDIVGSINEKCVAYKEVEFVDFLKVELKNAPLRISSFIYRLNIKFRGLGEKKK